MHSTGAGHHNTRESQQRRRKLKSKIIKFNFTFFRNVFVLVAFKLILLVGMFLSAAVDLLLSIKSNQLLLEY